MRFLAKGFVAGCLLCVIVTCGHAQPSPDVNVQVVKYDGLKEAVLKNRGKVVIVDFWSTTCIPCIRNFPHVLELQQKHGKDGLAVISVSLDPLSEGEQPAKRTERVLKRLRILKATGITNLLLDESTELVQKKLRIVEIPSVYVFNRRGHWTHFASGDGRDVSPKEVEELALKWLQEK